jgi:hypothetical protein
MAHLRNLFSGLDWWRLRPDVANTFLVSGVGSGQDRAVAARAGNRSFALVYLPGVRTITVNLDLLAGPNVDARWYDPSNGSFKAVSGSPFPATGQRQFNPGSDNAFGFSDWVLILESRV